MTLGIDLVDVERFRRVLERSPGLLGRFFTDSEKLYCESRPDPALRFAATFAAKEAVVKALNLTPAPAWARRIEIIRGADGAPHARAGDADVPVSISHDGPVVVAVAYLPGAPSTG